MGFEDRDYVIEKHRDEDEWFTKPKKSSSEASRIGVAVFIAIVAAWAVREMYAEYQARKLTEEIMRQTAIFQQQATRINAEAQVQTMAQNAQNEVRRQQAAKQEYLNNYWADIGGGIFINAGRTQKRGDITTAVIRQQDGEQNIDINCRDGSFYSANIQSWHRPQDPQSVSARVIKAVCHS